MKNKFALCFRPVAVETEDISDINAVSKDIIVAKVKKNHGTMPPSMSPSLLKNSCGSSVQIPSFPPPKNHSRKTLSGALKTILLESSTRMRVQGGKIREIKFPEETNDLEERKTHLEKVGDHKRKLIEANIIGEKNNIIPSTSSSSSSPSSSFNGIGSSSSSDQSSKDFKSLSMKRSLTRSGSNPSFDKKKKAKITKTNGKASDSSLLSSNFENKDMVLYWMVLALLASILWGKLFAILLATLWLYYIPSRSTTLHQHIPPENNSIKLPEIVETSTTTREEYNKKVIMEGLLERRPLPPQKALIKSLT